MVSRDQEEASITKFSDEFRIQAGFKQPVVIDFGVNIASGRIKFREMAHFLEGEI